MPACFPVDYDIYRFYLQTYHNRCDMRYLCCQPMTLLNSLRMMVEDLKNDPEIQPHEIMTLLNWMPVYKYARRIDANP